MAASGSGISMDCISGGGGGGGGDGGGGDGNVFPPFGEVECGSGGIRVVVVAGLVVLVLVVVNQTKTDSEDVFRTKDGISGSSSRACRRGTLGNRFVVLRWVFGFAIVPLLLLLLLLVVVVTASLFGFHWTWTACFRKVRLRKSVTE